jgi:hypothetical protein
LKVVGKSNSSINNSSINNTSCFVIQFSDELGRFVYLITVQKSELQTRGNLLNTRFKLSNTSRRHCFSFRANHLHSIPDSAALNLAHGVRSLK